MARFDTDLRTCAPLFATLLMPMLALACASADPSTDGDETTDQPAAPVPLSSLSRDLDVGSSGGEVAAVHDYLSQYGYFPNQDLSATYPTWSPVVAELPARVDVFDERSGEAVTAYQRYMGLPETGIVDAATRAMMREPRCGNPDGIQLPELVEKYALSTVNPKLTKTALTWKLEGSTDFVTRNQTRGAIALMLENWAMKTSISFSEASSSQTPDITIRWAQFASNSDALAATSPNPDSPGTVLVRMRVDTPWSIATPTPGDKLDLFGVLLHEFGHAIGIGHSSLGGQTVMQSGIPRGTTRRVLQEEDAVPASILYDEWIGVSHSGAAYDIAVSSNGAVWILSEPCAFGGCSIQKKNGTGWEKAPGVATRIAVDSNGVPWITDPVGNIYKRSGASATSGSWNSVPGCAKDIAIGKRGHVWILDCQAGFGGYAVKRWDAANSQWVGAGAVGVRIAVDPFGSPLVITPTGVLAIFQDDSWGQVINMGGAPTVNSDIYVGPFGYVYAVGANDFGKVLGQNRATASTSGVNTLFAILNGPLRAIAAGPLPNGTNGAWAVRTNGSIIRQFK